MKINLRDIRLSQLNNKCTMLLVKYVRLLRLEEGTQLKLQDKDILVKVSKSARLTNNADLIKLYKDFKEQVRFSVFKSLEG